MSTILKGRLEEDSFAQGHERSSRTGNASMSASSMEQIAINGHLQVREKLLCTVYSGPASISDDITWLTLPNTCKSKTVNPKTEPVLGLDSLPAATCCTPSQTAILAC